MEKLKKGKGSSEDGMPNEMWKYGGKKVEYWIWIFCCRVWKGEDGHMQRAESGRQGQ